MGRQMTADGRHEEARVEVLALAHELQAGDRLKDQAIRALGRALDTGDVDRARRMQRWLTSYYAHEITCHHGLRNAFDWPETDGDAA